MTIKYKIIGLNEDTHSVIVRYYTDTVTEEMLASNAHRDDNGIPVRCRTDTSITLPEPLPSQKKIHEFILSCAPVAGIKLFEKMTTDKKAIKKFSGLKKLLNKEYSATEDEYEELMSPKQAPGMPTELSEEEIKKLLESTK